MNNDSYDNTINPDPFSQRILVKHGADTKKIPELWIRVDGLVPSLVKLLLDKASSLYPGVIRPEPWKPTRRIDYAKYFFTLQFLKAGVRSPQIADALTKLYSDGKATDAGYSDEYVRQLKRRVIKYFFEHYKKRDKLKSKTSRT